MRWAGELASQDYDVGFGLIENGVGLVRAGDHAYRAGHDSGALADLIGERNLVTGGHGNWGVGNHAAGGAVNQIDAQRAERFRQGDGLLEVPAAGYPIGRGNADE